MLGRITPSAADAQKQLAGALWQRGLGMAGFGLITQAQLANDPRAAAELQAALANAQYDAKRDAYVLPPKEKNWFDQQPPPPAPKPTSSTWMAGKHRVYLTQLPQQQREVVVPRTRRVLPNIWSQAGPHQRVGWNLYTDLFECQDCGKGASTIHDLGNESCT